MENSSLITIKAQSIIETSLVLVAGIAFLLGAFRVGLWYNNEIGERQSAYQNSRVEAGSNTQGQWPVYVRRGLTEEWVLEGASLLRGEHSPAAEGVPPWRERRKPKKPGAGRQYTGFYFKAGGRAA